MATRILVISPWTTSWSLQMANVQPSDHVTSKMISVPTAMIRMTTTSTGRETVAGHSVSELDRREITHTILQEKVKRLKY